MGIHRREGFASLRGDQDSGTHGSPVGRRSRPVDGDLGFRALDIPLGRVTSEVRDGAETTAVANTRTYPSPLTRPMSLDPALFAFPPKHSRYSPPLLAGGTATVVFADVFPCPLRTGLLCFPFSYRSFLDS